MAANTRTAHRVMLGRIECLPVTTPSGVRRRITVGVLVWLLAAGGTRLLIAQPELCGDPNPAARQQAIDEAVAWFDRNQFDDGRWVYDFDVEAGVDRGGYNITRHAGVLLSLYQAGTAGSDLAFATAEDGLAYAENEIRPTADGRALYDTGATALLLNALVERRNQTGDTGRDALLLDLGAFLRGQLEPSGAVLLRYDFSAGAPVPDVYGAFSTGEAFWAFARLHRLFPDDGWDDSALAVGDYLATDRNEAEDIWPPPSAHWGMYGFHELVMAGIELTATHVDYLNDQAELFGVQVRYESQRTTGLFSSLTRGPEASGGGVGTLGEGLGNLVGLSETIDLDDGDAIAERARCIAGVLIDRQITADEADELPDPGVARGSWASRAVTRMDSQQHAMSALLITEVAGP